MTTNKEKYYIVRGDRSGVFFGKIAEHEGREVRMTDVRRIWYWEGAATLSQLSAEGTKKPSKCKFTMPIAEIVVLDAVELIPCADQAAESINSVRIWKF